MANALINQERGLYSARGVRAETVWRPWQVEKKIRETADVITFVVKRIDDRLVKTSLPGQYVTVNMLMPDWVHQPRQAADSVIIPPGPPVAVHPVPVVRGTVHRPRRRWTRPSGTAVLGAWRR